MSSLVDYPHERDGAFRTPAGLQSTAQVARRRRIFAGLSGLTYLGLAAWMASIVGAGGWTLVDAALMLAFLAAMPWAVVGFWNSAIGFWLLRGGGEAQARIAPFMAQAGADTPLRHDVAVVMTLRNEDTSRSLARLRIVMESVEATGEGARFGWFVLSDTSDEAVAAAEAAGMEAWRHARPTGRIVYRRRTDNAGFKAGNLRDFCERWGDGYETMLVLDADSLMTGETILAMARVMDAHPRLGILQSLVVGMPSASAFARIFQFGMRQGMRPYTMGAAWWGADCGPFWGHNALVRIAPFRAYCHLPVLPGTGPLSGAILSHDQVEAVLMRRAGFEVRVLPCERGSFEDNPPTLAEFSRRELRWCHGNLQYLKLLRLPGLLPMSRFQLLWAILMFLGIPAFAVMIVLAALKTLEADAAVMPMGAAAALYGTYLVMYLFPKIAGVADILVSRGEVARYGGWPRFVAGAAIETAASFLVGAATTFRVTLFMAGLPFGRRATWSGQARDAHRLTWSEAARGLWPQLLFGVLVLAALGAASPVLLLWSLPLTLGYVLAIPFAVVSSAPSLGAAMARLKLCAVPEELHPVAEIVALNHAHSPVPASGAAQSAAA